jgi:hypothetical protein
MRVFIAALVLVFGLSSETKASYKNGNQLYKICTEGANPKDSPAFYQNGYCQAYLMAAVDMIEHQKYVINGEKVCIPDEVTGGQLVDVVRSWLDRNPQHRHFTAASLVVFIYREAWPCK